MKVAILGAGHGGSAAAVDLTLRGIDVVLCSALNPEHIKPLMKSGELHYLGEVGTGSIKVRTTTSVKDAIDSADLIMITTPSTAHERYAKILGEAMKNPRPVLLNGCTTGGALHVSRILAEKGLKQIPVCEMNTLAYASRLQEPTQVNIYHRMNYLLLGVFPGKLADEANRTISEVYPQVQMVSNVLETSLSNLNMILHPPGTVLNTGWIEFLKGEFYFYSQGITPAVARVIERVDAERLSILKKMGLAQIPFVEHFYKHGMSPVQHGSVYEAMQASDPDRYIKSPSMLNHRYLLEDVSYGLVPMISIARELGLRTPTCDSLVNLACILNEVDHWNQGLTAEKLGISELSVRELKTYLRDGEKT